MQKHQNIKALFLSCIFSIVLLHQIVPHSHHQHQAEHHYADVTDNYHGHHCGKSESGNSKKGFFAWFMKMHIHTGATTDVMVLQQTPVEKKSVTKELVKTPVLTKINQFFIDEDTTHNKIWYHSPDRCQKSCFLNRLLRGPPSLG